MKTAVGLRLDPDLLRAVDEARGDVPRNRWIERAVEAALPQERGATVPGVEDLQGARQYAEGIPGVFRGSDLLSDPGPEPGDPGPAEVPRNGNGHPETCFCEDCLQERSGE